MRLPVVRRYMQLYITRQLHSHQSIRLIIYSDQYLARVHVPMPLKTVLILNEFVVNFTFGNENNALCTTSRQ